MSYTLIPQPQLLRPARGGFTADMRGEVFVSGARRHAGGVPRRGDMGKDVISPERAVCRRQGQRPVGVAGRGAYGGGGQGAQSAQRGGRLA